MFFANHSWQIESTPSRYQFVGSLFPFCFVLPFVSKSIVRLYIFSSFSVFATANQVSKDNRNIYDMIFDIQTVYWRSVAWTVCHQLDERWPYNPVQDIHLPSSSPQPACRTIETGDNKSIAVTFPRGIKRQSRQVLLVVGEVSLPPSQGQPGRSVVGVNTRLISR